MAWRRFSPGDHLRGLALQEAFDANFVDYFVACSIDASAPFGGLTLLFCGTGAAKRLPKHPQVKIATVSNTHAKRFSSPLVSIKGEIVARLLARVVANELSLHQLAEPPFKTAHPTHISDTREERPP
jgi:hypothetical protein